MSERKPSIVFGATGMVGSCIVEYLARRGEKPIAISRKTQPKSEACFWLQGDLLRPDDLPLPASDVIYCAADPRLFAPALPRLSRSTTRRVVVISSSSIRSKISSPEPVERSSIERLAAAENAISSTCRSHAIEWTMLRPTLIYREGFDRNVTRLASLIQRLGFLPLYGSGNGLRQPVHAEDLALGAIAAASSNRAANKAYYVNGSETISYCEMVGRIFDALGKPRRVISLPAAAWSLAFVIAQPLFPGVTGVMGQRMLTDLVFDSSEADADFGWRARGFHPRFPKD